MNVGSIFELANRTGLWMFCGVRREDDVSGPRFGSPVSGCGSTVGPAMT
jgi:hypothetical protein